jgi:hypothetical protein
MKRKSRPETRPLLSGQQIDAMTPAQRRKLLDDIAASSPEQRRAEAMDLSPADQARITQAGRKLGRGRGRPKFGRKGVKIVSVTVEIDLLKEADAYAASHGLKRAELFTRGLRAILPKAG